MPRRTPRRTLRLQVALFAAMWGTSLLGCATPPKPDSDSATVWGFVKLVPKKGASVQGGGYGDRRLARVRRVDYSHTRYAVVCAPTATPVATSPARFAVRESLAGVHLEPAFSVTSPASGLELTNETHDDRIISIPGAGRLERLAPGRSVTIRGLPLGESSIHLLGASERATETPAQVWVTEGVFSEVDADGRYVLHGIAPGMHEVRAWHPRLPPSPIHHVELSAGAVERIDIEIGVDVQEPPVEETP